MYSKQYFYLLHFSIGFLEILEHCLTFFNRNKIVFYNSHILFCSKPKKIIPTNRPERLLRTLIRFCPKCSQRSLLQSATQFNTCITWAVFTATSNPETFWCERKSRSSLCATSADPKKSEKCKKSITKYHSV